ncbi:MAG: Crp/Fnr family transcriptional regulator [Burkholderiales bacterium]|jgi:CRP-like cAMP-binding protein
MHVHQDRPPVAVAAPLDAALPGEPPARRAARLLSGLPLFDGVPEAAFEAPLDGASVLSVPIGTVLFRAGEPAEVLYVVVDGRVRLTLGRPPTARLLATLGRGDTIGLAALLRSDVYPVNASVVEAALLVGLPAGAIRHAIDAHPLFAARLIGDMGAKLARFVRDIGGFTQRTARSRVARLLCDLHRDAPQGCTEIVFDEPKRLIASRLAMTPETLSRELHTLAAQGLIDSRRTRFMVLDAAALAEAAEDAVAVAGTA